MMILMLVFVFTISMNAQKTNIVVAIAKEDTSCSKSTDLAYNISYGDYSTYELSKSAVSKVKRKVSNYDSTTTIDNIDFGTYLGDYIVVIVGRSKYGRCNVSTYGVGFGHNSSQALKRAISNLQSRNWNWKKRNGYSVKLDRRL